MLFFIELLMIFGISYCLYLYNQYVFAAYAIYLIGSIIKAQLLQQAQQKMMEKYFGKKDKTDNSEE